MVVRWHSFKRERTLTTQERISMSNVSTALFVNFSNEAFTGYWNDEAYVFGAAGSETSKMYMEDWKARHFAKHLANRELLKVGQETHTSPKNPEQDKIFMSMFNKAFIAGGVVESEEVVASKVIDMNSKAEPAIKSVEVKEVEFVELQEPEVAPVQVPVEPEPEVVAKPRGRPKKV